MLGSCSGSPARIAKEVLGKNKVSLKSILSSLAVILLI
jgi:hypothetical protein